MDGNWEEHGLLKLMYSGLPLGWHVEDGKNIISAANTSYSVFWRGLVYRNLGIMVWKV